MRYRNRRRPTRLAGLGAGGSAAALNGLLNSLVAAWELNEASGNALDSHSGGYTLTETSGTIGAGTGPGGVGGCRVFAAADTEYVTRAGNDAGLQFGDADMTLEIWVSLASKAALQHIAGRLNVAGSYGWQVRYRQSTDRFTFQVSANGTALTDCAASTFGSPSTGTWYQIVCTYDAAADLLGIRVNDGTPNTASHASGFFATTTPFRVGADGQPGNYFDGSAAKCRLWSRKLSDSDITTLYNGGTGLPYTSFTA